jgi:hypothetical protein
MMVKQAENKKIIRLYGTLSNSKLTLYCGSPVTA